MAEYAACFGGLPDMEMAWPLFVSMLERRDRFWARSGLMTFEAVADAISTVLGGGATSKLRADRRFRESYPVERKGPSLVVQSGGADD